MSDKLHKNHFVDSKHPDFLIDDDDLMLVTFARREQVKGKIRWTRSTVNIGKNQYMEIVNQYGIASPLSKRWEYWDAEEKKNVPL